MLPLLESTQNPKIKKLLTLMEKPKERRASDLFVVEGVRELSLAIGAGYMPQTLFFQPQLLPDPQKHFGLNPETACFPVSPEIYQKIAYRESTEGVIAIMEQRNLNLDQVKLSPAPLVIIAEAVEKPGNLGAILRTADAAQADAVLICDPQCDLYNPNVIRSSLGCIFTRQVLSCTSAAAIEWLRKNKIKIYAAVLQNAQAYHLQDYRSGSAIVLGTESRGLSQLWRTHADACIAIPMRGVIDSLNVSVSAAILVFEVLRQREP